MKNLAIANKELNKWCGTEDINYPESLDSLFKYAVPKLQDALGYKEYYKLLLRWVNVFTENNSNPALALFWAIWEVIK